MAKMPSKYPCTLLKALNEDARPPNHAITCLGKVESPSVVLMSRRAKDRMDKTNLIKKHGQNHAIKNSMFLDRRSLIDPICCSL